MNDIRCKLIKIFGLLWVSSLNLYAADPIIINVDSPNFRKLVVAIPPLAKKSAKKTSIDDISQSELNRLLDFTGFFKVLDPNSYLKLMENFFKNLHRNNKDLSDVSNLSSLEKYRFSIAQWRALGIELVILGEQLQSTGDKHTLLFRVLDVSRGEFILGKKYSDVETNEFKTVLSRFSDQLMLALTGKKGVFSTKIVFSGRKTKDSDKQIYICDFDGSNVEQITFGKYIHLSPSWSPKGDEISFTSFKNRNPDVFIYNFKTKKQRVFASAKGIDSGSAWSPDGNIIAFTRSFGENSEIYYGESNQSKKFSPLIRGSDLDVEPAFSPDKKWLAYVSGRFGKPDVYVGNLDWKSPTEVRVLKDKRLTYVGWYNSTPAWSPDSQKITFAGYDRDIDRYDLFIMDYDGKNMDRLTLRTGDNESPSWSPDGQMIVFQSNRIGSSNVKGRAQLHIMNKDGTNQRKINTGLYEAQSPMWSPYLD